MKNKSAILLTTLAVGAMVLAPQTGNIQQAKAAVRDQGADASKYQGNTFVKGQASDRFGISQLGGIYSQSFIDQATYFPQISTGVAQALRMHTYIWLSDGSDQAQTKRGLDYYLPKIQTPKGSIVAIDYESGATGNIEANTANVAYAMNRIKQAGYTPMLYSYKPYMLKGLNLDELAKQFGQQFIWVAAYPHTYVTTTPDYNGFPSMKYVAIWQFTDYYGHATGLDGNVDLTGITQNGYGDNGKSDQGGGAVTPNSDTPATNGGQDANNTPKSDISVGYTVKVNFGATKWANGTTIPSWVKGKSYKVQQVNKSNKTVLLAGIMSWIKRSDVEILQTNNTPSVPASTYVVKSGDSWWSIANSHGLNMYNLASLNGVTVYHVLHPGDTIKLSAVSQPTVNTALPAGVHAENGFFYPNQRLMIWKNAGYNPTNVYYYKGEVVHYQGWIHNGAYSYAVYQTQGGSWRYVAVRHLSPNYALGTFGD